MTALTRIRFRTLQDVYAAVPSVDCTGRCAANCTAIWGTARERGNARRAGVDVLDPARPVGTFCPALTTEGRCGVWRSRPTICRLYGVAEGLECQYGCQPETMLTKREAFHLLNEAQRLGGKITGA